VQQVGIKYYVYNIVAWKMYNIKFAKLYFIFSTLKGIDVGLSFANPSDKHNYTVIDISILVRRSEALIDVTYSLFLQYYAGT